MTIQEQTLGPDHPRVANSLIALADVALASNDPQTAQVHAERALATLERAEVSPGALADARFMLARTLWSDQTQRVRASSLARQAHDAYATLGDAGQPRRAELETWLAEHPTP